VTVSQTRRVEGFHALAVSPGQRMHLPEREGVTLVAMTIRYQLAGRAVVAGPVSTYEANRAPSK
jgi:hypothetical protein